MSENISRFFISAIGTDSGKTIASAIIATAMNCAYWKPIQAGCEEETDSATIRRLNSSIEVLPETYFLKNAESPHAAAEKENISMSLQKFPMHSDKNIVIEGAGGLLVPLNHKDFMIDLAVQLKAELIIVVNFYLGSINHTLLSLDYLKKLDIKVRGIVFNGEINQESYEAINRKHSYKNLLHIPHKKIIDQDFIEAQALEFKKNIRGSQT